MSERDIMIDVTGGIKTASIAGASITFNSQVMFQYVQTQPPYEVYAYDVLTRLPRPSKAHENSYSHSGAWVFRSWEAGITLWLIIVEANVWSSRHLSCAAL